MCSFVVGLSSVLAAPVVLTRGDSSAVRGFDVA